MRTYGSEELASMRSNVYISHRGIEALLTAVQKEGFPTNFTKSSQLRARNHVASTPVATYGKLVEPIELPLKNGRTQVVWIQNPLAALCDAMHNLKGYASMVRKAMGEAHPPSSDKPWHLVIYSDEISMSPLKEDRRKTMAVYYSFLELGADLLMREEAWFTVAVVRSTLLKQISGGASYMYRRILHQMFPTLRRTGVHTTLCDSDDKISLYAECAVNVADQVALQDILYSKGHAGLHPCIACRIVFCIIATSMTRQARLCP